MGVRILPAQLDGDDAPVIGTEGDGVQGGGNGAISLASTASLRKSQGVAVQHPSAASQLGVVGDYIGVEIDLDLALGTSV